MSQSKTKTKTAMLRVTARPEKGFRRAGRHWPPTVTEVPADAFTDAEREALEAEPNLIVQAFEAEAEAEGDAPAGAKAGDGKAG